MKKLIALALFACTPLLCMEPDSMGAQLNPDALISFMKEKVDPHLPDGAILKTPAIVLLYRKGSHTAHISPVALIRKTDGEYKRAQMPADFETKLVCGDDGDEIEVTDPSDGSKHHSFYSLIPKLITRGTPDRHIHLFLNRTCGRLISIISDYQSSFYPFLSASQTIEIPVKKIYPFAREINTLSPTEHPSPFKMPELSSAALIAFNVARQDGSIVLPKQLVAVTPEGCFTLPFPTEKIKTLLQTKRPSELAHWILSALANLPHEADLVAFTSTFQESIAGLPKKSDVELSGLLAETHATSLSPTKKISWETLQRYKESLRTML